MKSSKRIRINPENITARDIYFFRKDLNSFKNLILKMQQDTPKASVTDCIEGYNVALETLIFTTNTLRAGNIYRYIALETLLNSRDCNSIIHEINESINLKDLDAPFNGCIEHDYFSLIKSYYHQKFVTELR